MLQKDTHGTVKQNAALFFKFPKTYHLNAMHFGHLTCLEYINFYCIYLLIYLLILVC